MNGSRNNVAVRGCGSLDPPCRLTYGRARDVRYVCQEYRCIGRTLAKAARSVELTVLVSRPCTQSCTSSLAFVLRTVERASNFFVVEGAPIFFLKCQHCKRSSLCRAQEPSFDNIKKCARASQKPSFDNKNGTTDIYEQPDDPSFRGGYIRQFICTTNGIVKRK